jgi:radical SAM protein with 4Fe4S-binding SPASM domain
LVIRAGDLVCAPCHRTCYSELYYGKFNVNEDNTAITDFEPQNVALLIGYTNMKRSCLPHCENCKFQAVCVGHCHGVSWEEYRNPLVPPLTVCNMYKAKLSFLIYKYNLLGIFDEMPNIKHLISNNYYEYLMDLIQDIVGGLNGE